MPGAMMPVSELTPPHLTQHREELGRLSQESQICILKTTHGDEDFPSRVGFPRPSQSDSDTVCLRGSEEQEGRWPGPRQDPGQMPEADQFSLCLWGGGRSLLLGLAPVSMETTGFPPCGCLGKFPAWASAAANLLPRPQAALSCASLDHSQGLSLSLSLWPPSIGLYASLRSLGLLHSVPQL